MSQEENKPVKESYREIVHQLQATWHSRWYEEGLYATPRDTSRPKFYCLDFFPYPSGAGLSVGHLRNYVPSDVISRMRKMQGFNVLHPMGWDAFGFPAENYAIREGVHPSETTKRNIANYKRQMMLAELSYDWSKELSSVDPAYYRWTQWFFLLLYERGLAYQAEGMQWWCPSCQSVLANEQVENGRCWRHTDVEVTKKALKQWYFKITDYADALLEDLPSLDWPEPIKKMQDNWIGKSYGCEAMFSAFNPVSKETFAFPIFTTRIDTVFGVTYMVMSPEHPLVDSLTTPEQRSAVDAYRESSAKKSEIDRLSLEKEKTGVFTGSYAINPLNNEHIPIWLADYVILSYGTGIVMAVPAHDTRDFAFASKYSLPVRVVISPDGRIPVLHDAYVEPGIMVNSGIFNDLNSRDAIERIIDWLEGRGLGKRHTNYKIRDWLISRQRYWGAPIPIVHCPVCGQVPIPKEQLPVLLPDLHDFTPPGTGESPLARVEDWVKTVCPRCGGPANRETDTMDGFACSSWYFLRFPDPHYDKGPFDPELNKYWLPVDLYIGGAEHAVMHLLYARFWTKVMHDAGLIHFREPFPKLRSQGMILGEDGMKMSKSRGNIVTPDLVVGKYGPDTVRLFILFLGSFEQEVAWDDRAISGVDRFLSRAWELFLAFPGPVAGDMGIDEKTETWRQVNFELNQTIKKVTEDIENFSFNTAVAQMMTLLNVLSQAVSTTSSITSSPLWANVITDFLKLLAPIAPFFSEEVWLRTGRRERFGGSIHLQPWPSFDPSALVKETIEYPVQINGKIRERIIVSAETGDDDLRRMVMDSDKVQKYIEGKEILKFVIVPKRLISIAVR